MAFSLGDPPKVHHIRKDLKIKQPHTNGLTPPVIHHPLVIAEPPEEIKQKDVDKHIARVSESRQNIPPSWADTDVLSKFYMPKFGSYFKEPYALGQATPTPNYTGAIVNLLTDVQQFLPTQYQVPIQQAQDQITQAILQKKAQTTSGSLFAYFSSNPWVGYLLAAGVFYLVFLKKGR